MKTAIVSIGDELLIGQTVNTNASYLGDVLSTEGYEITEVRTIKDTSEAITLALDALIPMHDFILITGGLGPTDDDLTTETVAAYFSTELEFHQETYDRLKALLESRGRTPLERHRQQAQLPATAVLYKNMRGTAPGMKLIQSACACYFMPGVPFEMKGLMEADILPDIKKNYPLKSYYRVQTLLTAGVGETVLEDRIKNAVAELPDFLHLAYLPSMGLVKVRLSGRHVDEDLLNSSFEHVCLLMQKALGKDCYGLDASKLETVVVEQLKSKNLQLSMAESCTAGNISSTLVNVAGLSDVFPGSFVCYSYEWKEDMLGVQHATLSQEGAVSEACISEMLDGLLAKEGCTIGLAISGILGPTGATADKPVGTVYMGVAHKHKRQIKRFQGFQTRAGNKHLFTNYALNMLRLFIDEI